MEKFHKLILVLIILISTVSALSQFGFVIEANADQCIYEYFADNILTIYDVEADAPGIHVTLTDPNESLMFEEVSF